MVNWNVHRKEMEWGGRKLVLETGKIVLSGTGEELSNSEEIQKIKDDYNSRKKKSKANNKGIYQEEFAKSIQNVRHHLMLHQHIFCHFHNLVHQLLH